MAVNRVFLYQAQIECNLLWFCSGSVLKHATVHGKLVDIFILVVLISNNMLMQINAWRL